MRTGRPWFRQQQQKCRSKIGRMECTVHPYGGWWLRNAWKELPSKLVNGQLWWVTGCGKVIIYNHMTLTKGLKTNPLGSIWNRWNLFSRFADHFRTAIMACVQNSIIPHSITTIRQWRRQRRVARQVMLATQPIGLVMAPFAWDIIKRLALMQAISSRRISIAIQRETHRTHHSSNQLINSLTPLECFHSFSNTFLLTWQ